MNCVELQQSLAEVEDGSTPEQSTHLKTCPACSELLQELNLIVAGASELQASDEPSPRVWNSIEIALRQEGLIRPQPSAPPSDVPSFSARWGSARWLVPAAAMLLLLVGIYERRQQSVSVPVNDRSRQAASVVAACESIRAERRRLYPGSRGQRPCHAKPIQREPAAGE